MTLLFLIVQRVLQPMYFIYFLAYNTYTLLLVLLSARRVRRRVTEQYTDDLDLIDSSVSTKPITMIVPAYNEEVTIVDTLNNMMHLDYPHLEVVVVNDGSKDGTMQKLKEAFRLRRNDLPYRGAIGTKPIRAMYEANIPLPPSVAHLYVLDKENGGKADALNAGINAATAPYVVSLDADSILDPLALKAMMRMLQEDPRIIAVGGQVAIANGCTIRSGRVVSLGVPKSSVALFQMVEYLRSFTTGRTALDALDSVLILSGVFAVFDKQTLVRAGGYLTPYIDHKLTEEYVGGRFATVCEDMEVVVRLHRYVRDKGLPGRVAYLPLAVAWTECPESLDSLRKQRGRWFRGLRESLRYHRAMLFNPRYGRVGWFALPAFWLFEYYGALLEFSGYLLLVLALLVSLVSPAPLLSWNALLLFAVAALGYGILVNVVAVLVGVWRFRLGIANPIQRGLLPFARRRDVLKLLLYAVLENFGYRQLTLWWRLRGWWDAKRGKTSWEKFARVGFKQSVRRNA